MTSPTPADERDSLKVNVEAVFKDFAETVILLYRNPDITEGEVIDPTEAVMQLVDRYTQRKVVVLQSDLARAVGLLQGVGHPDEYLEKRYAEMLAQLQAEKEGSDES